MPETHRNPSSRPSLYQVLALGTALAITGVSDAIQNQALAAVTLDAPAFPVETLDTVDEGMDFPDWGKELKEVPNETLWRLQAAEKEARAKGFTSGKYFAVDVEHQVFGVMESNGNGTPADLIIAWPTSTAKKGLGTKMNSGKTPTGAFELKEVDGRGGEIGTVRAADGYGTIIQNLDSGGGKPTMTTRVILMHGLDDANANTAERDIAIHGTNWETQLGNPASGGCVRLNNYAVIMVSALMKGNKDGTPDFRNFFVIVDSKDPRYAVPATHQNGVHDMRPQPGEPEIWSDHGPE